MNLKAYVGSALMVSIFLAGNIILFGVFQNGGIQHLLFSLGYFVMCLAILIFLVIILRDFFQEKSDLVWLAVFGFLICVATTYATTSMHLYNEKSTATREFQTKSLAELDSIMKTNDYYTKYEAYLQSQIASYQDSSRILQLQIEQKTAERQTKPVVVPQPVIIIQRENTTIIPPREEREREEDD